MHTIKRKVQADICEPELKNLKALFVLMMFFLLSAIVMPQYFGVNIGYDITCARLSNILFIMYMLASPWVFNHFFKTMLRCEIFYPMVCYLLVAGYTMVFRVDINAFFLVFFEFFLLFMMIYGCRYVIGWKRAVKGVIGCAYFLSIYGMVEFAYGKSLFLQFLSTMWTPVSNCYRSGLYRVMGPCGHPLGYGLVLLLFVALACIDLEKDEIYLFKRPVLIVLLMLNVFLTGSRSTLGIAAAEMLVIMLISGRTNIKKSLLMLVAFIFGLGIFLLLFHKTGIGRYILMQITSVLDTVLGTEISAFFGADVETLNNSEAHREVLPKIFTLDWLNPWVGRGVKRGFSVEIDGIFVHSVDNYYVVQYIKYAYPGLVSYVLFMITTLVAVIKGIVKYKSVLCKLSLVAIISYFFNLWWLDSLQTLKYAYIVIAIVCAYLLSKEDEQKKIMK